MTPLYITNTFYSVKKLEAGPEVGAVMEVALALVLERHQAVEALLIQVNFKCCH